MERGAAAKRLAQEMMNGCPSPCLAPRHPGNAPGASPAPHEHQVGQLRRLSPASEGDPSGPDAGLPRPDAEHNATASTSNSSLANFKRGYQPNCATDCEKAMAEYPFAFIYCEIFLAKLRRHFRRKPDGARTHQLVLQLMGACAAGNISSEQLASSLTAALAGHKPVLQAVTPLLASLDATINSVPSKTTGETDLGVNT